MPTILVDSNILLDIADKASVWHERSLKLLEFYDEFHRFIINPIIYAEVSIGYRTIEEHEAFIRHCGFEVESVPKEALFLAGKVFLSYRRNRGNKIVPLPDFFIGAHAAIKQYPLMTRDLKKYKTYFPSVKLITV